MSIFVKNNYFAIKLLERGFVANVKWREEPGFGIFQQIISQQKGYSTT